MIKFPEIVVYLLIMASLIFIAVSTAYLLVILVKDIKTKKLW